MLVGPPATALQTPVTPTAMSAPGAVAPSAALAPSAAGAEEGARLKARESNKSESLAKASEAQAVKVAVVLKNRSAERQRCIEAKRNLMETVTADLERLESDEAEQSDGG